MAEGGQFSASESLSILLEKIIYHIITQSKFDGIAMNDDFDYHGDSGNIVFGDTLNVLLEKILYQLNTLKSYKQNWINWVNEDGQETNRVVRFRGEFTFQPIAGEEGLYEAIISHKDSLVSR